MIGFCNKCGSDTAYMVPSGDTLPRHVCKQCGHIQYENPKVIAGCVAEYQGSILLCRRAIVPRIGYWTLPAGFMENGETTQDAACRETLEEAGAEVSIESAFALINIASINQVHIFYRGVLNSDACSIGTESLEVGLFKEEDIPWDQLAFRSVEACLQAYCRDRKSGGFQFHELSLNPAPGLSCC